MHKKVVNIILIILGFISLGLGIVGIILPVLPTTPFFLLTLFCFARGSKKFYDWFVSTSLYKKHLDSFVKNKTMTLKTKLFILIPVSIMLIIAFYFVDIIYVRILIIFLTISKYVYFFKYIKTIPNKNADAETKN